MQKDLDEVNQIIEQDPFHQHQIADYQVIEFYPSKVANGLRKIPTDNLKLTTLTKPLTN